jgi:bile acid-coenzyme A ligase
MTDATAAPPGARPPGQILTDLATSQPEQPAVTCNTTTITYGQLERRANRLARAYRVLGVGQGDTATIALPNSVEFVAACFAIWKLGAVPQPVSWRLPDRERDQIIELAKPALVVGADSAAVPSVPTAYEPDARLEDTPLTPHLVPPIWKITTTGGSTGRPKLIVVGLPGAFDPQARAAMALMRPGDVQLAPGPLYHNAPFAYGLLGVSLGQHVVIMPKFDATAALDLIAQHRVSWTNLVPTMMLRMARLIQAEPLRWDISSLRTVWHMAAPCPAWLKQTWIGLVGADNVHELYGSSEGLAGTAITGREWLEHRGSVGRVRHGEMKIFDEHGNGLQPGRVGEIYMRKAAGSAELRYRYIGAEARSLDGGWESFGDMGWLDSDGYLYLADRRTDMIVVGGANIYPAEVEAAILEHPDVLSCAVVGIPDDDLGERLHAVIEASRPISDDTLLAFLAERVAPSKQPRSFRYVSEPVRDDAGKLRRAEIRDRERAILVTQGDI